MRRWTAMLCLMAALALCFLTGCGAKDSLHGTWETSLEMSVLGVGVEPGQTGSGIIRFTFLEDGSGNMDTEFGQALPEVGRPFQYTADGDQLTLTYDEGTEEVYTFALEGDTLTLENHRISLELARTS